MKTTNELIVMPTIRAIKGAAMAKDNVQLIREPERLARSTKTIDILET
jgi:hypothetical protein